MHRTSWQQIEIIRNYSNYEILDSLIRLTYDQKAYYEQSKHALMKESMVKNIAFNDVLNQIEIHSLKPTEGDPQNMSDNMRVGFTHQSEYLFWLYFDDERIVIFTRLGIA